MIFSRNVMLKSYSCSASSSRGRMYKEKSTPYRNEFERDRDRIIHSNAFKRLQYKTQVFVNHEGDHYRNRLTHSIEVSAIARSISKALGLSDDLTESVALAHDLGHSPFGHAGEDALDACMEHFGGFSHNAHSFKILTHLEQKYAAYNGLNLTWEVLEGVVKHNGPLIEDDTKLNIDNIPEDQIREIAAKTGISSYILQYNQKFPLDLHKYSSAEAQVASLADDIAYIAHDIEDGVRAQLINYSDLERQELTSNVLYKVKQELGDVESSRLIYELVRKLIHHLVKDLLKQTTANIEEYNIKSEEDIRNLGRDLVCFSGDIYSQIKDLKAFLKAKMYQHEKVEELTSKAKIVVRGLFNLYKGDINLLPQDWKSLLDKANALQDHSSKDPEYIKMSFIADYIAGMTDRFAIKQYQTYYNLNFSNTGL